MAFESARSLSYTAAGVIPQNVFVELAAGPEVDVAGANAEAIGVSLEAAAAQGDRIPVAAMDGAKVEVLGGAAIDVAAGVVPVTSDATGRAVTAGTGERILGFAVSSIGAADEYVTVVLLKGALAAP